MPSEIPGNPFSLLGMPRPRRTRLSRAAGKNGIILTDETRRCLQRLASYNPPVPPEDPDLIYPLSRSAAVLVALFVGRTGELYVMLNRRAENLRSFPGDTSLPGGRWEPGDRSLEDTARREAFEEIGLPFDKHKIPLLCCFSPFLAGNYLLVTPVVVLVLDPDIRPILNEPEVAALFSHPFSSFLSRSTPFPHGRHEAHRDPRAALVPSPFYSSASNDPSLPHLRRFIENARTITASQTMRAQTPHAAFSKLPDLPASAEYNMSIGVISTSADSSPHKIIDPQANRITDKTSPGDADTRAQRAANLGWRRYRASSEPDDGTDDEAPELEYYSYRDIQWGESHVRMHRFLTGREDEGVKPVYGLTAAILLHAATIGYEREPEFPSRASSERIPADRIAVALRTVPVLIEAVKKERTERGVADGALQERMRRVRHTRQIRL